MDAANALALRMADATDAALAMEPVRDVRVVWTMMAASKNDRGEVSPAAEVAVAERISAPAAWETPDETSAEETTPPMDGRIAVDECAAEADREDVKIEAQSGDADARAADEQHAATGSSAGSPIEGEDVSTEECDGECDSAAHDEEDASECASVQDADREQAPAREHDRDHDHETNSARSRRRKRSRRYVFSNARRNRGTTSTTSNHTNNSSSGNSTTGKEQQDPHATPAVVSEAVAWEWSSCADCFEPIAQAHMDVLARVRRECADIVASNHAAWRCNRRLQMETATVTAILDDADNASYFPVRRQRRGRWYRDVWEEEDFAAAQQKQEAQRASNSTDKQSRGPTFADADVLYSNHDLVRGYDDELFREYVERLEYAIATGAREHGAQDDETNVTSSMDERALLSIVPSTSWHPAACGLWSTSKKTHAASFDSIHPASIRQYSSAQSESDKETDVEEHRLLRSRLRTSKRRDEKRASEVPDEKPATIHPSTNNGARIADMDGHELGFGDAKEEDEISRELDSACLRLVELSALNWRQAQTIFERACCHTQTAPLLEAEEASCKRLETLYQELYPRYEGQDEEELEARMREGRFPSRPRHLIEYAKRHCADPTVATAVSASVEYAMRLSRGDEVDVLDHKCCWNEGVVVDLYMEGAKSLKFVLVSFSLWSTSTVEWIAVTAGRLLPRGVADGRAKFVLAKTSVRKSRMELNQRVADVLEQSYPLRRLQSDKATAPLSRENSSSDADAKQRVPKKRRKT